MKNIDTEQEFGIDFVTKYEILAGGKIAKLRLSDFVISSIVNNDFYYYLNDNYKELSNNIAKNICYNIGALRHECSKTGNYTVNLSLNYFKSICQLPGTDKKIYNDVADALNNFIENKLDIKQFQYIDNEFEIEFYKL